MVHCIQDMLKKNRAQNVCDEDHKFIRWWLARPSAGAHEEIIAVVENQAAPMD